MDHINISKKKLYPLKKRKCEIKCIEGILWVTYKNSDDIILRKNESVCLNNEKSIVIQGLSDSSFELC